MNAVQRILWHGLWLVLACTVAFSGLFAQTAQAATGERVALLIGNARYSSGLPPLVNPPQDVAALEASLKKLGFSVQVLKDVDQKAMGRAIKQFGTQAQEAQVAFFYYSGHGMQAREENYLIPVGAGIESEADLDIEAVALRSLMRQIDEARPQNAVVVLDACRDNPVAVRTKSASKGLSRINSQPTNTLVVFAALAGNTASDNGVFAKALASHITQPNLGLRGVFDNVNKAVRQASGNKQSIQRDDQLSEDVVLLASVVPVVVQPDAEQEAWEIAKRRDTVASYQVYLNRYPSGRYAQTARDALEGLQPATIATPTPAPAPRPVQQAVEEAAIPAPPPPAQASQQPGQAFRDCTGAHCPEMVAIPAGSFVMGSNERDTEKPPNSVSVRSFALGKYEVTQGQWKAVMGSNPSEFKNCGDNCPVERVSWDDIQQYLAKLNGMTGMKYRLASEAEWEYAARAGCSTAFNVGGQCRDKIEASEANFDGNYTYNGSAKGVYRRNTTAVGSFRANNWGLHDMHGNVWEWVEDVWHDNYAGAPTDGSAWKSGGDSSRRVLRSGSWGSSPDSLRSANRVRNTPYYRDDIVGFRLARTVP